MTVQAGDPDRRGAVAAGLVGLANALRAAGLNVGTEGVETAAEALAVVDAGDRDEVYWALRSALTSGRDDAETFDRVFEATWAEPSGIGGSDSGVRPEGAPGGSGAEGSAPLSARTGPEALEGADAAGAGWSAVERLRRTDFADYGPRELAAARRLIERLGSSLPTRRSRRLASRERGDRLDLRRTMRAALRTGGHPVRLLHRGRKRTERRLVFLLDVSGSMQPYTLPVTIFLHAVRRSSRKVEAFTFGTRATRLTRALDAGDPEKALAQVAAAVPDWAGGTRIGASLRAIRTRIGGAAKIRGAIVVIVSDGWERGDLALLATEMERIQRAAHAVVWVNPLAGEPDYEPLAAGMAVARPFVDLFLPGHDLRSLETLASVLENLSVGEKPADRGVEPHAWAVPR